MKRSISLLTLVVTLACSNPTDPGSQPKWADNTSWKGSVTMKSGTTFNISFRLTTAFGPVGGWSSQNAWGIVVEEPRMENVVAGKVIDRANTATDPSLKWVHLEIVPDSAFDPLLPSCATNAPSYEVDLHLAGAGTLAGTVTLSCHFPETTIDGPQPIVMRQI